MAQKLSLWRDQKWAAYEAINRNSEDLDTVELSVRGLQTIMQRQAQEILRLRAMIMGIVEVIHAKAPFDDAELEAAVQAAWVQLTSPPSASPAASTASDPYRGTPVANAAPERVVVCTRCGRSVPASRTNITALGEVCDACA
jgi:hypothetical protein